MEEIPYYPGCSLKDKAKGFEKSAMAVAEELGAKLRELERWNCCGTVYSLTEDNLMKQLAPLRNLIRARDQGYDEVYTLCSMCYNTLKRANELVKNDQEKLDKINAFMDEEEDYEGSVEVKHFLELIPEDFSWNKISEAVESPLNVLNIAPYYGCMLLRPKGIEIDDPNNPSILDNLIEALGGNPVSYPYETECCGSYNTVERKDVVTSKTKTIVGSARENGADLMITSCPLCHFNLDQRQSDLSKEEPNFANVPTLYFTQLMAVAYGRIDECDFSSHRIDPRPILAAEKIAIKR